MLSPYCDCAALNSFGVIRGYQPVDRHSTTLQELYAVPNADELRELTGPDKLFMSGLFKLQLDELIQEVTV